MIRILLNLIFGKQDKIERRTQPRSCHCWGDHAYMLGRSDHLPSCPMAKPQPIKPSPMQGETKR